MNVPTLDPLAAIDFLGEAAARVLVAVECGVELDPPWRESCPWVPGRRGFAPGFISQIEFWTHDGEFVMQDSTLERVLLEPLFPEWKR